MSPTKRLLLQTKADTLLRHGHIDQSVSLYRRLGKNESALHLRGLGNQALATGDVEEAVGAFVAEAFLALRTSSTGR